MPAKKRSNNKNQAEPFLGANKDAELEKKVDQLLDITMPENSEASRSASSAEVAPLLPTDKLPNLDATSDIKPTMTKKPTPIKVAESAVGTAPPLPGAAAPAKPKKTAKITPIPITTETPELLDMSGSTDEPPEDIVGLRGSIIPKAKQEEDPLKTPEELELEDVGTSKAVDDIIAEESDKLLDSDDSDALDYEESAPAQPVKPKRKGLRGLLASWWRTKWARNLTFLVIFAAMAAVLTVPKSRYYVLNTAGVRSAASVTIYDQSTNQPLRNAELTIAGVTSKTDNEGNAKVEQLKLGPTTLLVKKVAYAEVNQPVTIGWGSNPFGEFKLQPTGTQYKLVTVDFVSKKPVKGVEASSGQATATSNDKGEIVLTVPQANEEKVEIIIAGASYRIEKLQLERDTKDSKTIELVPARKHAFISKRSGVFDVYKIDLDGKNEEKVLAGTGRERPETMALAAHPTKDFAALVSVRDNNKSKDNKLLSTLTLVDLRDNSSSNIVQSERIQLVGWSGDNLVYVKITDGEPQDSQNRHQLVSYDVENQTEKELASTNYFNDVIAVKDSIYYSPAAYNVKGAVGFYKINASGNDKKTIYDKEIWSIIRASHDKLSVSIGQEWFDVNLDTDVMTKAASPPAILKSRIYINSPDSSKSLWIDERDGKGVLLAYDVRAKTEQTLLTQAGLKNPVLWRSNEQIIYRINTNQETADYILDVPSGKSLKIRDVTDTAGIDRWYYY